MRCTARELLGRGLKTWRRVRLTAAGLLLVASLGLPAWAEALPPCPTTPAGPVYGSNPVNNYLLLALAPDRMAGLNFPWSRQAAQILPSRVLDLPVLGGWFGQGKTANLEQVLRVRPRLALVSGATVGAQASTQALHEVGIPTCEVDLDRMQDYPAAFRRVGQALGVTRRADALAADAQHTLDELAALRQRVAQRKPVRIYYAEGEDGLASECPGSIHAEVIEAIGAHNALRCVDRGRFGMVRVSFEQILAADPDWIVTQDGPQQCARFQASRAGNCFERFARAMCCLRRRCRFAGWIDRPLSFA